MSEDLIGHDVITIAIAYGKLQAARLHNRNWSYYITDPYLTDIAADLYKLPDKSMHIIGMAATRAQQKSNGRSTAAYHAFVREVTKIKAGDASQYTKEKIKNFLRKSLHRAPAIIALL